MRFRQLTLVSTFATAALISHASCSPAEYEIIKDGKKKSAPTEDDRSTPQSPPATPTPGGLAPVAQIEVIWNNQAVTRVWVNEPTRIRPAATTLDPDYAASNSCTNPGIVKADFTIGDSTKVGSERKMGCEDLAVPHVFAAPGDYVVTMSVTSQDHEIATSKMILTVIERHQSLDPIPVPTPIPGGPFDPNQNPHQKPEQLPRRSW